jgi:OOP family OmpA-OmpF porin
MPSTAPHRAFSRSALCRTVLLACFGLALAAGTARAAGPEAYLFPAFSAVAPDGDRQTDDGWRVALTAGLKRGRSLNVEGEGFYERLGEPNGAQYRFGGAGHALWFFHRWSPFAPFVLGGVGVMVEEDYFNESPRVYGELGGGFMSRLAGTSASLRVDLRYRQVRKVSEFNERPFADGLITVGLVFPLKGSPPPAPPPLPPPAPKVDGDADGDGVPDSLDRCADTPTGAPVNGLGCVADSDLDGVNDLRDRCPATPPGAEVDAFGCEPDADLDGVPNRADACPGTRLGAQVDARGCPPVEVLRLEGVHFAHAKAVLTPAAKVVLNGVADGLKQRPGAHIEVAGHTDARGGDAYNRRLSARRAKAVRDYLVSRGVPGDHLTAKGYGESAPVADNATAEGRAKNRRVELRISEGPPEP